MICRRHLLVIMALASVAACADSLNGSIGPAAPGTTQPLLDSLKVSSANAPADGATLVTVAAHAVGPLSGPPGAVTMTTTAGVFVGTGTNTISLFPDDGGGVRTTLRVSKDPGPVFVRAYFASSTKSVELTLTRAFPQQLLLAATAVGVASGARNSLSVTATAARYPGWVSRGIPITFSLERIGSTNPVPGSLDGPVATDTLGNATIHYSPGTAVAPDSVLLVASAPADTGKTVIITKMKLYVTAPTP